VVFRDGPWKLSARVGGNLIWGLTCHGTPAICLLHEDERSLELAIDLDALIAVVMEERSERKAYHQSRSCPAVTALTATTPYR